MCVRERLYPLNECSVSESPSGLLPEHESRNGKCCLKSKSLPLRVTKVNLSMQGSLAGASGLEVDRTKMRGHKLL